MSLALATPAPHTRSRDVPRLAAAATIAGIALVPVQIGGGLSIRLAPSDALFAGAAILLLAADRAPARRLLAVWAGLFAVVTWAVVVGTARGTLLPSALLDRWVGAVALLCVAFASSTLDPERLGRGLRAASWITLACHVVVAVNPAIAPGRVAARNAGFLVDPNNAGVMVACLLTIELARSVDAARSRRRTSWPTVALLAGLAWALIETGSRTGYFGLGAGGVALVVVNRARLLRLLHRRALRIAGGALIVGLALRGALQAQLRSLQYRPDNIERRGEVLEQSWTSFVDHPLTGGGLMHTLQLGFGFPHNSLLWLLGDAGVVGFGVFVVIVVAPLRWLGRIPPAGDRGDLGRPIVCGLVVMTVASFAIEALYQRQWWVLIGAAAGTVAQRARVNRTDLVAAHA